MAGLYIHIPFCKRKCVYCDFYSTAQFERYSTPYLDSAIREMEAAKKYLDGETITTLYFGGGTPSLYPPEDIGKIIEAAVRIYAGVGLCEITLEANPEDLSAEYLAGLKNAGINRLSIGVQSFDDGILSFMKRRHNASKAGESIILAREAGFDNISIDLIYGIPGLSPGLWLQTLEKAISLAPEHISAYHLTFEPSTILGRRQASGKISEIPQEESAVHFNLLHDMLTSGGYEHYEVSNFARPGYRSRHNSSYWTGRKYLGIGPGAHSFDGLSRRWCDMSVAEYTDAPHPLYGSEKLSGDDVYNELVMTSLRCADGITIRRIKSRAGEKYAQYFSENAKGLIERGLLRSDGERYYIDPRDFLVSDNIISALFI